MASHANPEALKVQDEDIVLYESKNADPGPSADPRGPSLIILCTWVGGATPRRINKYLGTCLNINRSTPEPVSSC